MTSEHTETANCPICAEELNNPRMLFCIHSFCLACLEQYCASKQPGDDVTCPVCRTATEIPKDGLTALTVRMHGKESVSSTTCEVCSSSDRGVSATVYCVDCSQNLCERCSIPHKRMRGGSHDVKALEALSPGYHGARRYCGEHQERIRMYCFDCRANVCSTCCFEAHKRHSFERID